MHLIHSSIFNAYHLSSLLRIAPTATIAYLRDLFRLSTERLSIPSGTCLRLTPITDGFLRRSEGVVYALVCHAPKLKDPGSCSRVESISTIKAPLLYIRRQPRLCYTKFRCIFGRLINNILELSANKRRISAPRKAGVNSTFLPNLSTPASGEVSKY